jgi:7-cyano-7-deazaguanine synthase in queuosine biosynthesis
MSAKRIIIKLKETDDFTLAGVADDILTVSLDQSDASRMLNSRLILDIEDAGLALNNQMFDLLNFALAIYTVDQTVSRPINGFQGWSRYIKVYFPVNHFESWNNAKKLLEDRIGFLSGDKWEFQFRQNTEIRAHTPQIIRNPLEYTKVCLLSGGLDSFVASIDLISKPATKPVFVSHYKRGGSDSKTQSNVLDFLTEKYGADTFGTHRFYVQPKQDNPNAQKENSSRARSLLFITLGLSVANSLSDDMELILPENGLISLNIPLTKTRLSSHSTRTTHPYFVDGLNKITDILGIQNHITNPYRFRTKGQMMLECADPDALREFTPGTISCSHPEQSRYYGKPPGLNCGYCVPCIIRRSAEHAFGNVETHYGLDDVRATPPPQRQSKGSDYRAFRLAIERLDQMDKPHSFAMEVLRSGPLPTNEESPLEKYIQVFREGMAEVKSFLNG